jgi:hypothetical protein
MRNPRAFRIITGAENSTRCRRGATRLGDEVYFVVQAPDAIWAALILVNETAAGGPARGRLPRSLTNDAF